MLYKIKLKDYHVPRIFPRFSKVHLLILPNNMECNIYIVNLYIAYYKSVSMKCS